MSLNIKEKSNFLPDVTSAEEFYVTQSRLTDPGRYGYLFDDLPDDMPELCNIIQNLVLHYADEDIYKYNIPPHRYHEMDNRSVESMLGSIVDYDSRRLSECREVQHRIIGVCRDISILLCSILRHKGIPARLISGFSTYFMPGINLDGVFVEYWNTKKNNWCVVDSRTNHHHIKKFKLNIDFDFYDVPVDKFLPAETAWKLCRTGILRSNHFGSRKYRGLWYIRNRMLQEIAFINKHEMLIWDMWGLMLSHKDGQPHIPDDQYPVLDSLEQLLHKDKSNIAAVRQFYHSNSELCVSDVVSVYNPFFKKRIDHVIV